jgi:AcrR family transcriptional regulator
MDPKEHREQAIREAKRNLILDAARKVFAEKGYHDTRLEEIASEAGFSKASLYNYYRDKEDIYLHLAGRELERLIQQLEQQNDPSRPTIDNLEAMVRTIFTAFGDHFAFMLTMAYFQMDVSGPGNDGPKDKLLRDHLGLLQRMLAAFTAAIADGRRRGEVRSTLDDEVLARFTTGVVRSVLFNWRAHRSMGDIEREVHNVRVFVQGAVCTPAEKAVAR